MSPVRSVPTLPPTDPTKSMELSEYNHLLEINSPELKDLGRSITIRGVLLEEIEKKPELWKSGFTRTHDENHKDFCEVAIEVYKRTDTLLHVGALYRYFRHIKASFKTKLRQCQAAKRTPEETEEFLLGWDVYPFLRFLKVDKKYSVLLNGSNGAAKKKKIQEAGVFEDAVYPHVQRQPIGENHNAQNYLQKTVICRDRKFQNDLDVLPTQENYLQTTVICQDQNFQDGLHVPPTQENYLQTTVICQDQKYQDGMDVLPMQENCTVLTTWLPDSVQSEAYIPISMSSNEHVQMAESSEPQYHDLSQLNPLERIPEESTSSIFVYPPTKMICVADPSNEQSYNEMEFFSTAEWQSEPQTSTSISETELTTEFDSLRPHFCRVLQSHPEKLPLLRKCMYEVLFQCDTEKEYTSTKEVFEDILK